MTRKAARIVTDESSARCSGRIEFSFLGLASGFGLLFGILEHIIDFAFHNLQLVLRHHFAQLFHDSENFVSLISSVLLELLQDFFDLFQARLRVLFLVGAELDSDVFAFGLQREFEVRPLKCLDQFLFD